jgi:hypothetical protein
MTFDYEAMENRDRLTWNRMPDSVREMILEAERLGAFQQRLYPDGAWVDEMIFRPQFGIYRIVGWRAPGDQPEPPRAERQAVILGRVVEAGNVACLDGRPGLVIETTEAQLRDFGRNLCGCEVEIRVRDNDTAHQQDRRVIGGSVR